MRTILLPICLLLLALDVPQVTSASIVPRTIEKAHKFALSHSRNFARDLRLALGGVLIAPRDAPSTLRPVVYCKTKQAPFGIGGNSGSPVSPNSTSTTTGAGSAPTGSVPTSSPWKLTESHEGSNFFEGWSFWNLADPTHGIVQYLDENAARSNGLLEVNGDGHAIMRVETTQNVSPNRKSVRIQTRSSFNGGLLIMDSIHMPTGCGTWPAFWTNGPDWPHDGEIDIIEGVHDYTNNQATIHTDPGCRLSSTSSDTLNMTGTVIGGTDCAALTTGNQGCGIRASSSNSFGAGFNANGGGVYAMQWDDSGLAVFFFPSGSVPADIGAGFPHPETWGPALARWPADGCDPFQYFNTHSVIFDTTLCGDWAGAVWSGAGIPGQEESCAERTGFSTCEEYVRASGSSFDEAYWQIRSVKLYQFE